MQHAARPIVTIRTDIAGLVHMVPCTCAYPAAPQPTPEAAQQAHQQHVADETKVTVIPDRYSLSARLAAVRAA